MHEKGEMASFRSHIPALLFLTGIFFLNFLSRIILAPLLPAVETDLNIGQEGSFSSSHSVILEGSSAPGSSLPVSPTEGRSSPHRWPSAEPFS